MGGGVKMSEIEQVKNSILSTTAHKLRNLAMAIRLNFELLDPSDPSGKNILTIADQMDELVADIMDNPTL